MSRASGWRSRVASARRSLRRFDDAWADNSGPWQTHAVALCLLFAAGGWYFVRQPSLVIGVVLLLGMLEIPSLARLRQRQREKRLRRSPDLRRPD